MGRRKGSQNGRSFFKILIADSTNQLRIPPAFVKHFRGAFPLKCKVCCGGKPWHVEVIKEENDFFFGDGWSEFVHDNALELGELLLFKHEGNSKFNVRIYGKDACEKLPTTRTRKINHGQNSRDKKLDLAANNTMSITRVKHESDHEEDTILEAFDKYAYQKTYYKFQLLSGHIIEEKPLYVPAHFVRKMVNESGQTFCPAMLQIAEKKWPVKVYFFPNTSGRMYADSGEFIKDNNLQVGDVCKFELSETNNINVSIFQPTS